VLPAGGIHFDRRALGPQTAIPARRYHSGHVNEGQSVSEIGRHCGRPLQHHKERPQSFSKLLRA
jgi:hypothetical protein